MFESLLKYSSIFLKEAGLLKVPERLLQDVQDWAVSVYFTKVKELVLYKYRMVKKRNILVDKIIAQKETRPFKRVKKALEEGDIQYLLPYEGNQFAFRVGSFENEPDPTSGLQGNYQDYTTCYLEVTKTKDPNRYDLFYSGNLFKSQNEFKNITFEFFNKIWEDELYEKLNKMFDEFDIFLNQIESFSDSYIKSVEEELVECNSYIKEKIDIKHTNDFVEKSFYLNGQTIVAIFYFSNRGNTKGTWDEFISKNNDDSTVGFVKFFFKPEIPRYSDQYVGVAEKIKKFVRHELQHTIQTLIKRKTGLPGITEKVPEGDMEVLPFMMPVKLRKNKIPDEVKEGPNANSDLEHAHRSIEYHTRVADSVNDFKLVINTVPKQLHKLYFEAWINHNSSFKDFFSNIRNVPLPDSRFKDQDFFIGNEDRFSSIFREAYDELHRNSAMFKSFKEHDFEKYKLAVKEFYKEVEYLL